MKKFYFIICKSETSSLSLIKKVFYWSVLMKIMIFLGAAETSSTRHTSQTSRNRLNFMKESNTFFHDKIRVKYLNSFLERGKRNVDDLLDSYPDVVPDDKKNSVPRRIPPKVTFPNMTESELRQILTHIIKNRKEKPFDTSNDNFIDSLNSTEKALITEEQYEILKLVQNLNPETAKANFMWKLFRCIRSLSFIRCMGIFVWPMIVNNLPTPFSFQSSRDSRKAEEATVQELFGMSAADFESELMNRKNHIESNFIRWYKNLTESKFETNVGLVKLKGHGNGELAISFNGFREGRLAKIKDSKNLPSILTILTEVFEEVFDSKSSKLKNKKENSKKDKRKDRGLQGFDESSNIEKFYRNHNNQENTRRSLKDDQVINMLLEKIKPCVADIEDDHIKRYFTLEDAYQAFQVLFGPKISSRIANQIKSIDAENLKNYEEFEQVQELELVPLEAQENHGKIVSKYKSSKSRAMYGFDLENARSLETENDTAVLEKLSKFKTHMEASVKNYLNSNKKKAQTGLTLHLPKLNDRIVGRKIPSNLSSIGRHMKSKMKTMMPAAGLAMSMMIQMVLAHTKAAATVANLMSNMALGSAMFGMIRDMLMGTNSKPKIKYVYDNEKYDTGITWPANFDRNGYKPPSPILDTAPFFHETHKMP